MVEEQPSDLVWCDREGERHSRVRGNDRARGGDARSTSMRHISSMDGGAQCKHMCVRGSHRLLLATASSCIDLYLASNVPGPSSGPQPRSSPACAKPVCLKRCDVLRIENAPPSLCFG